MVAISDSDFIAAICSSQKHRFSCTSKPASRNSWNPDTHCQLIQRGDQSEAPFQHTLRGRVGKQSTVCIICTGYFFSALVFLICLALHHRFFHQDSFQSTWTKLQDSTGTHLFELVWSSVDVVLCSNAEQLFGIMKYYILLFMINWGFAHYLRIIDPFINYPSSVCNLITVLYFLE